MEFAVEFFPQLDFDNPATKDIPASQYKCKKYMIFPPPIILILIDEEFMNLKPGARNGVKNGLTFLIDVETYEYSFFPRSGKGFSVALSDSRDRPVVRQQGTVGKTEFFAIFRLLQVSTFNPAQRH